jgi:hypothetical protein
MRRARAVETISLLKRYIIELGVDRSLTSPLDDILMAFAEAERGRLLPLFEPKRVGHKLPTELGRLYVMARVSLVMDLFLEAGLKKEKAAREVATALRKQRFPIKGNLGVPAWRTVIGWREKLRKKDGSGADSFAKFIYGIERETYLVSVKKGQLDPKACAKRELEMISRSLDEAR